MNVFSPYFCFVLHRFASFFSISTNPRPSIFVFVIIQKKVELLKCVRAQARGTEVDPHVVLLEDSFEHDGPHGRHMCMVFEMLGANLLSLIKR